MTLTATVPFDADSLTYIPCIGVSCGTYWESTDTLAIALRDADGDLITKWYEVPQHAGCVIQDTFRDMPATNDNDLARNRFRKLIKTLA